MIESRNRKPLVKQASTLIRSSSISAVEILTMALETLWSNKLRTALTMLGIIIGIMAVIAVTAIGQGTQKATEQQLQSLGTDILQVQAGASRSGAVQQGAGSATTLTLEDAEAIAQQVLGVDRVSAILQQSAQVVYGENNDSMTIIGTDINYPDVRNTHPQTGRFFTEEEVKAAKPLAVLGPTARDELLGSGSIAEGAQIRISGQTYDVIGVMETKGAQGPQNPDEQIYIPLTNMSARLVGNNAVKGITIRGIYVKVKSQDQLDAAQYQTTNLLRVRHGIYPEKGDKDDFRTVNSADIINTLTSTSKLFTVMIVAVAVISLIVGGIGIANIMLVSVVERTREIGIRKAIGATSTAILSQFLAEAVVIAVIGGVIGIGLGIAIAFAASNLFKFPFVISLWSILFGFGLTFVIGLLAGVIPARNAASLDPIAALRSD
ncbi:ABC transporter substrate-binding protein [Nostoc sp. 'Peltigera membranacea cyanobiont' 232]|nr:ABC transporter permease [Nostoc sp. 'Peltigera membranacea cyanobiont' 232]OYE01573.1 ABC transporter substrate-binding protein [Nostoc sp. 'Peltigera membranacea cyanobiont' 232]